MALRVLLSVLLSVSPAMACDLGDPWFEEYQAQMRSDLPNITQNPELLRYAARKWERILVRMESPDSVVVAEEGVNVNLDCHPWLSRFPGGTIQWFMRPRDTNGQGRHFPELFCQLVKKLSL